MTKVLGIDSGNPNPCNPLLEDGEPAVSVNSHGRPSTPGAVALIRAGRGKSPLNQARWRMDRIKIGLGLGLLATLLGCVGVGYVDGGYGGAVLVPGPDVYVFGGGYERGRDVHAYSHRGVESRAVAHPGGGGHGGKR